MKAQKLTVLVLTVLLSAACTAKPQKKAETASSTASPGAKPQPTPSPSPSPTPTPEKWAVQLQKLNQDLTQQLVVASSGKPEKLKFQAMDVLEALKIANDASGIFTNLTPSAHSQWLELHKNISETQCANLTAGLKEAFPKPQAQRVIATAMNPGFWTKFCQIARSQEVRQRYSLRLRADGAVDFNFAAGESVESKESITFDLLAPAYVNVHAFQKIEATLASERVQAKLGGKFIQFKNLLPAVQGLNEWYAWATALESVRNDILATLKAMPELPQETDRKLAQTLLGGVSTWLSQIEPILKEAEEAQTGPARLLMNSVRMDQDTFEEKSPSALYLEATQALESLSSQLYASELLKLELALRAIPQAASDHYKQTVKTFEKPVEKLEMISPGAKALAENSLKDQR